MKQARWAVALLYVPALAVLAVYGLAFLEHASAVVRFPFQVDYGEMPELNRAVLLATGRPIYVDWAAPPYQMANYTPLYPLVAAVGVRLEGIQFQSGRLISLLSTLATSVAVGATAAALCRAPPGGTPTGRGRAALVGGLLYLAGYPAWNWGALQRVDAFAVALEWVGVALFAVGWAGPSGGRPRRPAWVVWATVPLFLAAVYARQTVAAGAVAVFGTAVVLRPRLGLAATAAYAAAGLGVFAFLDRTTGGQFRRHVVDGNLNDWAWSRVSFYWEPFWATLHWAFPLAAIGLLLGLAGRRSQMPLLYLLAAGATALTIGKIGSNVNYVLQLWAALSLLAGLAAGYAALPGRDGLRGAAGTLLGAAVAVWLLVGLQQAIHVPYEAGEDGAGGRERGVAAALLGATRWGRLPLWRLDPWGAGPAVLRQRARERYDPTPGDAEAEHARRAAAYVGESEGDVLAEEMNFTVTTGKRIYLQPFEFSQLAADGRWDEGPLLEEVRRGAFAVVVLRFRLGDDPSWRRERVNDPLLAALQEAYVLDAVFGDYYLYRYRPETGYWPEAAGGRVW